jgi:hypothetical protein
MSNKCSIYYKLIHIKKKKKKEALALFIYFIFHHSINNTSTLLAIASLSLMVVVFSTMMIFSSISAFCSLLIPASPPFLYYFEVSGPTTDTLSRCHVGRSRFFSIKLSDQDLLYLAGNANNANSIIDEDDWQINTSRTDLTFDC